MATSLNNKKDPVLFDNIPKEMRKYKQWIMWKYKDNVKLPYSTKFSYASVTDPNDWSTFKEVREAYSMGGFDGIGFVLTESDPYTIVDLDLKGNLKDKEAKIIDHFYLMWLARIKTYNEVSPSGKGYHAVFKKQLGAGKRKGLIEAYSCKRYMTFTGHRTEYTTEEIRSPNANCRYLLDLIGVDIKIVYEGYGEVKEINKYTPEEIIERIVPFDGNFFPNQEAYNHFREDLIDLLRLRSVHTPSMEASDDDYIQRIQPTEQATIPSFLTDDKILEIAFNAGNGIKFKGLYNGDKEELKYYPSQSEADLSLCALIVFYTKDIDQVVRIFMSSALGQRAKSDERPDYVLSTIKKALRTVKGQYDPFHKMGIKDLSNSMADREEVYKRIEGLKKYSISTLSDILSTEDKYPETKIYTQPIGLVGDIMEHIIKCSNKTNGTIALSGAVSLISRIVGNNFNTPCGMGLNTYIVCIADTGVGKDAIHLGINMLMDSVEVYASTKRESSEFFDFLEDIMGSDRFASIPALAKELALAKSDSANFICSEMGLKLAEGKGKNANNFQNALHGLWLQLYTASGKNGRLNPMKYADKEKDLPSVMSPNFNIIGESTKESYYPCITEDSVAFGLIPRIIHFHCDLPVTLRNKSADHYKVPHSLTVELYELIKNSFQIRKKLKETKDKSNIVTVKYHEKVDEMFDELDRESTEKANDENIKVVHKKLITRSIMNIKKLACLFAIGEYKDEPEVLSYNVSLATRIVDYDTNRLASLFDKGEVGDDNDYVLQLTTLRSFIAKLISKKYASLSMTNRKHITKEMYNDLMIPKAIITRNMSQQKCFKTGNGRQTRFAIENAITTLIDNGELYLQSNVANQKKYGTTGVFYEVRKQLLDFYSTETE